jgi:cyclopropane fatty-acyl-phospholipid synthase-like methyltransferase
VQWNDIHSPEWSYHDKARIKLQLLDNIDLVANKKILDLACHDGVFTEAMMQLGCEHVIGTNVRSMAVDILRSCLEDSDRTTHCDIVLHDLYDLDSLDCLLGQVDTIHFAGAVMHVNHHFDLLYRLCHNKPSAMILDSIYYDDTWFYQQPMVSWRIENSTNVLYGYDNKHQTRNTDIFVGTPNLAWYQHVFPLFGWQINTVRYVNYVHFEEKLRRRCVMRCERISKSNP